MKRLRLAPTLWVAALSVLCLPLISGAAGSTSAAAADSAIFVTTTAQVVAEDGECSLREAIHAANFDTAVFPLGAPGLFITTGCTPGDGADTIQLPAGATLTLTGPMDETGSVNIMGPTATPIVRSSITIEALGAKIVHGGGLIPFRAFAVTGNGALTIREAHIKGFEVWGGDGRLGGGGGLGAGGAVYVQGGELTIEQSTFEQNGALGGDGRNLPEVGATAGGGGGGIGGNGGTALTNDPRFVPTHGGGGGGARANGGDGGDLDAPGPSGYGGGRSVSGRVPCGGEGGVPSDLLGGGDGQDAECDGGGGGGGARAGTAFGLAGSGGDGKYGGGGGGGGGEAGDGGAGGFGGGGGASGILLSEEGGGGDGGHGGFGAGGGAGPDEPLTPGGPGQGGTFGGDAGLIHGGGGAGLGGAIFGHNANITITNSTFFNNYANRGHAGGPGGRDGRGAGGAIFVVGGSLAVVHSTLSGNATGEVNAEGEGIGGGGIVVYRPTDGTPTSFSLQNTILAGNGIHECYMRNNPSFSIQGNLIVDGSAPSVPGQTHDSCPAFVTTDPGLEPLKLTMPGRTPTMAIGPRSPAVDAAATFSALPFDQRGVQRPAGFEDIGAFEAVALAPVTTIALSPAVANGANGWYTGDPVGMSITAVDDGTVAETRCALDQAPAPASFDELPIGPCGLTSVGSDGFHTIYAASRDTDGITEGPPVSVSFNVDRTPPTLSPTLSDSPVVVGQTGVTASPNASDSTSGVASSSCGAVDTSTPGPKTVTCSATDNAGNTNSVEFGYVVEYRILGFFDPVPGSKWKVLSTVPVKIALGNAAGVRVSDAAGQDLAASCRVRFSASGAQTKSAQCMKYDSEKNQFVYSWKLGRIGTGPATIVVTIGYPGTASTTQKTLQITITK